MSAARLTNLEARDATLAAVNVLAQQQRMNTVQLRALNDRLRQLAHDQADTNTRLGAMNTRLCAIDENLIEVKDLLIRVLDRP